MIAMIEAYRRRYGPQGHANIELTAIGLGAPNYIRSFKKLVGFQGRLFVDPSAVLYQRVGFLPARMLPCSRLCCQVVSGCFKALYLCCTRGWCCRAGSVTQNGGVIVITNQLEVLYQFKEEYSDEHADPEDVFRVVDNYLRR